MTIPELVASVLVATQFLKNLLNKIGVNVQGTVAVILSALCSIGVVVFSYIQSSKPFDVGMIILIVQVVIASNAGYSLIKVARNV